VRPEAHGSLDFSRNLSRGIAVLQCRVVELIFNPILTPALAPLAPPGLAQSVTSVSEGSWRDMPVSAAIAVSTVLLTRAM
jgi:hypothetical protein